MFLKKNYIFQLINHIWTSIFNQSMYCHDLVLQLVLEYLSSYRNDYAYMLKSTVSRLHAW